MLKYHILQGHWVNVGNERWKGMTWGMMPLLGGALSACTYHFFYNSPDLDFLVVLQVIPSLRAKKQILPSQMEDGLRSA